MLTDPISRIELRRVIATQYQYYVLNNPLIVTRSSMPDGRATFGIAIPAFDNGFPPQRVGGEVLDKLAYIAILLSLDNAFIRGWPI